MSRRRFPQPRARTPPPPSLSAETFDSPSPSQSDTEEQQPTENTARPVVHSPIKRRNARGPGANSINSLSDKDLWAYSDTEILEAATLTWRSPVYEHYNISLRRNINPDGSPKSLDLVYECKFNSPDHKPFFRLRTKTSQGTTNLKKAADACLAASGQSKAAQSSSSTSKLLPAKYSYATHRALIALRCAKNFRPFNMVSDPDYILEVLLLRPGTQIPHPSLISRDIKHIYECMSTHVKNYFANIEGPIHLVLDGWTSPLIFAYLGLVVVWCAEGKINKAILEFIRLKSNHDGKYLAKVVAECMERFALQDRLFSVCMDNATNCDKLAEELPALLPSFPGKQRRLRCIPHILNLIAKESLIFISFFFKKPRSRKRVGVAQGEGNAEYGRPGEDVDNSGDDSEDEIVLEEGDVAPNEDEAVIQEAEADEDEDEQDEGQAIHNEKVAKTLKEKAIQLMAKKKIYIDSEEERIALQIFPRVSGLARRVHESATVNEKFQELIENSDDPELEGGPRSLTRRVPTRWNSDLACLSSHIYFREIIEELTSIRSLKLSSFILSERQWEIASDVQEVLLLFKGTTELFSKAEVPLIVDVIPMLENIREGLIGARDDSVNDVPNVIRVACQAGILLVDKYSTFAVDCPVYLIAIVMCPDRKVKWFKDHGRTSQQIKEIKQLVITTWIKNYGGSADKESQRATATRAARSRYEPTAAVEQFPVDSIQHYLKDTLASPSDILAAGGYIKYWTNLKATRPRLAQMALTYCSAPASSVDAERAFSSGRRQVNFMQHNMSSQTFKAQMAVGSWSNSPLYPGLDAVTAMISDQVIPDEAENLFIVPSTSENMYYEQR